MSEADIRKVSVSPGNSIESIGGWDWPLDRSGDPLIFAAITEEHELVIDLGGIQQIEIPSKTTIFQLTEKKISQVEAGISKQAVDYPTAVAEAQAFANLLKLKPDSPMRRKIELWKKQIKDPPDASPFGPKHLAVDEVPGGIYAYVKIAPTRQQKWAVFAIFSTVSRPGADR